MDSLILNAAPSPQRHIVSRADMQRFAASSSASSDSARSYATAAGSGNAATLPSNDDLSIAIEDDDDGDGEYEKLHAEREPLLGLRRPGSTMRPRPVSDIITLLKHLHNPSILRDLIKAVTAFALTVLLSFTDITRESLGFSSHMAAVAILFFHPCKSVGGMFEAVLLGILGSVFALGISLLGLLVVTNDYLRELPLVSTSALVSLIFISTFILSFMRARSSRPPVYTGTILAHLIIFTVLTSINSTTSTERVHELLRSIFFSTLSGVGISLVSNFLLWPTSASNFLRRDVSATILSIENLLGLLARSFLSGDFSGQAAEITHITQAMQAHQTQFIHLARSNAEAKLEFTSVFRGYAAWNRLISSLNRLTRHLGGLKSGVLKRQQWDPAFQSAPLADPLEVRKRDRDLLASLIEAFKPTLHRLVLSCQSALLELDDIVRSYSMWNLLFKPAGRVSLKLRIQDLQEKLAASLAEFDGEQRKVMLWLYQHKKYDGKPADEIFLLYYFIFSLIELVKEIQTCLSVHVGDVSGVAYGRSFFSWLRFRCCSENIVSEASTPNLNRSRQSSTTGAEPKERSKYDSPYFQFLQSQTNDAYRHYLKSPFKNRAVKRTETSESTESSIEPPANMPPVEMSTFLRHRLRLWHALSTLRNSFNTKFALKTSILVTLISILAYLPALTGLFHLFRVHWSLISIVVVMTPTIGGTNVAGFYRILGTSFGALYAFSVDLLVNGYLHLDYDLYGKWILFAAVVLFSVPCFYILLYSTYPKVGQVSLVTVCSILVANEANRKNPHWETGVGDLAIRQGIVVAIGILLGLVVNWYIWPFEARVELRKGLSDLLLNMGMLYSRLVEVFNHRSGGDRERSASQGNNSKRKITMSTLHHHYYERFDFDAPEDTLAYFMAFEIKLHMSLLRLNQLIPLTWLEPRLKGPFPVEVYRVMLEKCMAILDQFVAMRIALSNHLQIDPRTDAQTSNDLRGPMSGLRSKLNDLVLGPSHDAVLPKNRNSALNMSEVLTTLLPYRRELVGSVLQSFHIFSGCLILKQPLPTYLPPMKQSRRRLLDEIHKFMKDKPPLNSPSSSTLPLPIALPENFMNYYAYSLAMEDVIAELDGLGTVLKSLFGEMFADVVNINMFLQPDAVPSTKVKPMPKVPLFATSAEDSERGTSPVPVKMHQSRRGRKQWEASMSLRPTSSLVVPVEGQDAQDEQDAVQWWRSSGAWML